MIIALPEGVAGEAEVPPSEWVGFVVRLNRDLRQWKRSTLGAGLRSYLRRTAIGEQLAAVDEAVLVRRKEQRSARDFLQVPHLDDRTA